MKTIPQTMKIVVGAISATDAAGRSTDIVCLKNYGKCTVIVDIVQGHATPPALALMQATNVAGSGGKVLTNAVPIWANQDISATDTLVRQTDAVGFSTSAALANKQVVFDVDPRSLDVENGFDCLYLTTGASNVANLTHVTFLLSEPRYNSATPPSAIID
jgi:hypothetical protein